MKSKHKNGNLVISLDFELVWGVFDLVDLAKKKDYFRNTREIIPRILQLFDKKNVHATWATVGMLFNEDWDEWELNKPIVAPNYWNDKLNAYSYGKRIKSKESEFYCFAPNLIRNIAQCPGQELGTHTYSHYYCMEEGQNLEQFKADLQKAVEVARKMDIKLQSLVFPRNQVKEEYLKVCTDLDISSIRSNPSSWYWKDLLSETFMTKVARSGDAYFPFGNKKYSVDNLVQTDGFPIEQKASRFLRPVEATSLLRKLKLNRIKNEMTMAAKNHEVYHLWWHPHNFGEQPKESLEDLGTILDHFELCRKKYDFQSVNMQELNKIYYCRNRSQL